MVLAGGALLYSVTAAAVARAADNRDTSEFSLACGHFARLTRKPASSVTRVDVYVNPPLEERFRQTEEILGLIKKQVRSFRLEISTAIVVIRSVNLLFRQHFGQA